MVVIVYGILFVLVNANYPDAFSSKATMNIESREPLIFSPNWRGQ
jgi:hypothetical protein